MGHNPSDRRGWGLGGEMYAEGAWSNEGGWLGFVQSRTQVQREPHKAKLQNRWTILLERMNEP